MDEPSNKPSSLLQRPTLIQSERIQIQQHHPHPHHRPLDHHQHDLLNPFHQQQQQPLPFTTFISNSLLKLIQIDHPNPSLKLQSVRYISLRILRELATLEDVFNKSSIHRLLKFLTPSILPKSSIYPFLLSLILGGLQLKKLWKYQPQLLINLSISITPIIQTLKALTRSETEQEKTDQIEKDDDRLELRRWAIYWLIYCSIINLESLKVWSHQLRDSSFIISRPTIYPITSPSHQDLSHLPTQFSKIITGLRRLTRYLIDLLSHSIRPTLTPPPQSLSPQPPRIPMESFDLRTRPSNSHKVQLRLPDYLLGSRQHQLYNLIKYIFLRWCSSDRSRGSELIWTNILSPILRLIYRSDNDSIINSSHHRRIKVVKVIVSDSDDDRFSNPNEQATTTQNSNHLPRTPFRSDHKPIHESNDRSTPIIKPFQETSNSIVNTKSNKLKPFHPTKNHTDYHQPRSQEGRYGLDDLSTSDWNDLSCITTTSNSVRRIRSDPIPSNRHQHHHTTKNDTFEVNASRDLKRSSSTDSFQLDIHNNPDQFVHLEDLSSIPILPPSPIELIDRSENLAVMDRCLDNLSSPNQSLNSNPTPTPPQIQTQIDPKKILPNSTSASPLNHHHHSISFKTPENAWDSLSFIG